MGPARHFTCSFSPSGSVHTKPPAASWAAHRARSVVAFLHAMLVGMWHSMRIGGRRGLFSSCHPPTHMHAVLVKGAGAVDAAEGHGGALPHVLL